jgi:hypothetical protein
LGHDRTVELREKLISVNVAFATEIISIQEDLNSNMTSLMDKIGKILVDKEFFVSKHYVLSLRPPTVLLLQMLESVLASVNNVIAGFVQSGIDVDPMYLLEKYVPAIDWDEFAVKAKEYKEYQQAMGKSDPAGGGGFM